MRRGALAALAVLMAAIPLFGVYAYYVSESYSWSGPNASNWTLNNSYQASGDGIYASGSQGFSLISTVAVPDGSNSYEVKTSVKVTADTFTPIYVHYLRASADALAAYPGTGTFYAVQAVPSLLAGGACSMGISVSQRVSGSATNLGYVTTGCAATFTMQSVMTADNNILVYVNGALVMGPIAATSILTGKPGFGGYQMPSGSAIQSVALGGVDRVAPGTIVPSQVRSFPLWNSIELEWPGALDDANGTGVYRYVVSRNGTVLGTTQTASFADQTVAAGTNYTYAVQAIDMHGNIGAAASFAASSTASNTRDSRRVGLRPFGSYWGGGGEQIDVASGNLNFSIPLIKVLSRNGKSIPLGLSYNSQNWRKDANGAVWRVGRDIGYGFGWMLTPGFVKAYYSDLWAVHHYSFTNASGAEVRLDYNDGGIWRSKEGETVAYSPLDRRLRFPDGSYWVMDCVSRGTEEDAGTMYPRRLYTDSNGNYVEFRYQQGQNAAGLNTSGRITSIDDVRSTYIYTFYYTAGASPHLDQIGNYAGTGEYYSFVYGASQTMYSPFTPAVAIGSARMLSQVSNTAGATPLSHSFEYGTNGAGELTKVTYPYGADLQWSYGDVSFGNGTTVRELTGRWLRPKAGAAQMSYLFVSWSPTPALNLHSARVVQDANHKDEKVWWLNTDPSQVGYALAFAVDERRSSPYAMPRRVETFYTLGSKNNLYLWRQTTKLDAWTTREIASQVDMVRDGYGNLTERREYDYGNLTTPARTYQYSYYAAGTLNRVQTVTLAGVTTPVAEYRYDAQFPYPGGVSCPTYSGQGGAPASAAMHDASYTISFIERGNAKFAKVMGKPAACVTYDAVGNVIWMTNQNPSNGQVNYSYSDLTKYTVPATVTPDATNSLATAFQYDSLLSLTQTTAPNGATTGFTYENLRRPASTTSVHGAVTTYAYNDSASAPSVTATTNGKFVRTSMDGLGRTVKVETGYGSTVVSIVETEYAPCACSPMGRVWRVSRPYAPSGTPVWTVYEYDLLGRTVSVKQPGDSGTTTYLYDLNTVKVSDPKGKWKKFTMDGLGRLVQVTEPRPGTGGASVDETYYTYNVFDKLTQVSMTRGGTTQLRTFVYDGEQRLQSVTQPETGTVTYTYDALGRTSTKTDAKNQKVEYVYDSHSRVSEVRRYPVSSGAEDYSQRTTFVWEYQYSANSAGRVGLIQHGNGFMEYLSYTPSGLVGENGLYAPGAAAWLVADYAYNNEGQRTGLKYPDIRDGSGTVLQTGRTINSTFDSMGRLASIRDPGLYGGTDMVTGAQYNAAGQLTQMTVAWEGSRTFAYSTSGQLTRQTSPGVDLEYVFPSTDNDGRLWKKKDWVSGEEVTYQYDEIGRLTAAATTGPEWGLSWSFDGFGNRLAQTVTKGSAPAVSVSVNAATNRVVGLGYDNNGNQTSWTTPLGPVTAGYDVDNRLASISAPNGSEVYAYSAANQRLRKAGKLYFYGVGGELLVIYDFAYGGGGTTPLNPKTQVYFGGMLVFGEGDRRITMDRLGSTVRTEGYFQPEYRYRYYPYGEQQGGSVNEDQVKFGTYWRDSVSGLDYAQNRYFSASSGRFTTTDQGPPTSTRPQSWNRYSYSWNDPVNLNDPDGNLPAAPPGCIANGFGAPGGAIDASNNCPPGFIYLDGMGGGNWTTISLTGQLAAAVSLIENAGGDVAPLAKGYRITVDADLFNFMVDAGTISVGTAGPATLGGILIGIDWSAAGATIGAVLTNPVTITVAAGVVAIGGVAWYMAKRKADLDAFDEAVRRYERECGRQLSKDDRRRLHISITGQGYGIPQIVADAKAIFGCPKTEGN